MSGAQNEVARLKSELQTAQETIHQLREAPRPEEPELQGLQRQNQQLPLGLKGSKQSSRGVTRCKP